MKSILLVKTFLGLVEMTSGLVNASFSLPEWQAVKIIFFAPWSSSWPSEQFSSPSVLKYATLPLPPLFFANSAIVILSLKVYILREEISRNYTLNAISDISLIFYTLPHISNHRINTFRLRAY